MSCIGPPSFHPSPMISRSLWGAALGALAACAALFLPAPPTQAANRGLTVEGSLAIPNPAGQRVAVLLVPFQSGGPRSALAHADEEAYRKRLREIGFEVW